MPLKPEGYRFTVHMPEAATLAEEADVRMAGVNVGKVKTKELDKGGARTIVEVAARRSQYAPIPKDTQRDPAPEDAARRDLPGARAGQQDGGHAGRRRRDWRTRRSSTTVELDEIFTAFDQPTRQAFRDWVKELRRRDHEGTTASEDLNDAFGNFEGFAVDGAEVLQVLDEQNVGRAQPGQEHRARCSARSTSAAARCAS